MKSPMRLIAPLIAFLLIPLSPLPAQDQDKPQDGFSQAELDQMLAPIALYPDVLLSQVLMAATYPLEVVEAARWSRAHSGLEGDAAVQAVEDKDWDDSVKALVAFPELIQLMDENLDWTRRLGDAFLMQEQQVMETAQNLRRKALDEGSLDSLSHVTVEKENDVIVIQPADVRYVFVPYYNPLYVYGDWWWYDCPPYYWGPPRGSYSSVGILWSRGFRISVGFYYSSCDWHHHRLVVARPYHSHYRYDFSHIPDRHHFEHSGRAWQHEPIHRRGIDYRRPDLNSRFDRHSASGITSRPMPLPQRAPRADYREQKPPRQQPPEVNRPDQHQPEVNRHEQRTPDMRRPDRERSPGAIPSPRVTRPERPERPGSGEYERPGAINPPRPPRIERQAPPQGQSPRIDRQPPSAGRPSGTRPPAVQPPPPPPPAPTPGVNSGNPRREEQYRENEEVARPRSHPTDGRAGMGDQRQRRQP